MKILYAILFFMALLLLASFAKAKGVEAGYDNKLIVNIPEQDLTFTLNGRVQIDYNQSALEDETLENNAEVRRVWLTFTGKYDNWFYLSRVDMANSSTKLSRFIEYRGLGEKAWISFGRHKEPFGMSWVGSIKNVTFPERSAVSDRFTLGRNEGVMLRGKSHGLLYAVGAFESDGNSGELAAEHIALTGRLVKPVYFSNDNLFHVGGGFSAREEKDVLGLELAAVLGPWHIQSEWMQEEQEEGEEFSGSYFEAGYFFTSDRMNYSNGVFKGVKPNSPSGAWQLLARIDNGDGDYSDIQLGEVDGSSYALGLIYYPNRFAKIAASYTEGEQSGPLGLQGSEFRLRAQFTF